jgi:hypothetical protein
MTPTPHRLFQQRWPEGEYRLFQLGFVVEDLLGAAEQWARVFGVGPFHLHPRIDAPCTYRGTPSAVDVEIAVAQAGPVQIELIKQHCNRPSVYRDLFDKGASGFHQVSTVTPDYDGKKEHYGRLGFELASEFAVSGLRVAYFDTMASFGFFTEVVEETPAYLAHLDHVARTCAEWDGSDPVYVSAVPGYRTP